MVGNPDPHIDFWSCRGPSTVASSIQCIHHTVHPAYSASNIQCIQHTVHPAHSASRIQCIQHTVHPAHSASSTQCIQHTVHPEYSATQATVTSAGNYTLCFLAVFIITIFIWLRCPSFAEHCFWLVSLFKIISENQIRFCFSLVLVKNNFAQSFVQKVAMLYSGKTTFAAENDRQSGIFLLANNSLGSIADNRCETTLTWLWKLFILLQEQCWFK